MTSLEVNGLTLILSGEMVVFVDEKIRIMNACILLHTVLTSFSLEEGLFFYFVSIQLQSSPDYTSLI